MKTPSAPDSSSALPGRLRIQHESKLCLLHQLGNIPTQYIYNQIGAEPFSVGGGAAAGGSH